MSAVSKAKEEYLAASQAAADAESKSRAAEIALERARLAVIKEAWGVEIGSIITVYGGRRSQEGAEFKVCEISRSYGIDPCKYKPSVQGNKRKKDGGWSQNAQYIGEYYEVVTTEGGSEK